ncbi:MAG: cadherin repeat domain-containing protein, partial [Pirellulaceae bacterium]
MLNYEIATSHQVTIRATSADGSFSTQVYSIGLTDVDEFDVGVIADANAVANAVQENSANGTIVGLTASAIDLDGTTNQITYSLDNDAGGRFAIHASTGVVTVAASLDFETSTRHSITVRATSADTSFSTQSFTISVLDIYE